MTKIVNLNRVRKALDREKRKKQADENAVRFGRSAEERRQHAKLQAKRNGSLDHHRLDPKT